MGQLTVVLCTAGLWGAELRDPDPFFVPSFFFLFLFL